MDIRRMTFSEDVEAILREHGRCLHGVSVSRHCADCPSWAREVPCDARKQIIEEAYSDGALMHWQRGAKLCRRIPMRPTFYFCLARGDG